MADRDTGMMPGSAQFPSTHWSIVLAARNREAPDYRESMDRLIGIYWRPVYVYIRAAWSRSNAESKDLTQEFLSRLIAGNLLEQYDRNKGRFRAYLKGALRHFLMDEKKSASRQKRGGGLQKLSLDFESEDKQFEVAAETGTPDELFDKAWGRAIMQRAIETLHSQLKEQKREICYQVFERYEFPPPDAGDTSYKTVANEMKLKESTVKAHLTYARLRLKKILRDKVFHTVTSEEELFQELKELFEN